MKVRKNYSLRCLFIFLIISLALQKTFHLVLSIFVSVSCTLEVTSKK